MLVVVQYLGAALVVVVFVTVVFMVFWFLMGLLRVWVLSSEIRGMSRKEVKKAEQQMCKHHNTYCKVDYKGVKWLCCDCDKVCN